LAEEDVELQRIKQQKMLELQRRLAEEEAKARVEAEKQAALRVILTPEARQRLANIRMVRPEFAEQLEIQLIQLAQTGRVRLPITDEELKEILSRISSRRREITIRRV
jgi:programmed cell death protein 5